MERHVRVQEALDVLSEYEDVTSFRKLTKEDLARQGDNLIDRARTRVLQDARRAYDLLVSAGFNNKQISDRIGCDPPELCRVHGGKDVQSSLSRLVEILKALIKCIPKALAERMVIAVGEMHQHAELIETCLSGEIPAAVQRQTVAAVLHNMAAALSDGNLQRTKLPLPGALVRLGISRGPLVIDFEDDSLEGHKEFVHELKHFLQREEAEIQRKEAEIAQLEERQNGSRSNQRKGDKRRRSSAF